MLRKTIFVVAAISLAACGGGDSGTGTDDDPTIPTANLVPVGGGNFTDCGSVFCKFVGDGRNSGSGCAEVVRGVVKFLDAAGAQLGASEAWELSPGTVIRSGESFTFTIFGVNLTIVNTPVAATTEEFSWTDVSC